MRRFHANTTLIFLGSCLLFAEGALGVIAAVTDVNPTLLAVFALVALGMVLTALVIMYLREPAFLTISGEQAHDLRRLEIIARSFDERTLSMYVDDMALLSSHSISGSRFASERRDIPGESEDLDREQQNFSGEAQ